ncbi:MAG TPA: D-alanine--D-serine ligase VanG [Candidatus Evtepia faecavium]|nr:D-alanine--D-serine ligase VanG [Candidatus Evtepia faecavium]
MKRKPALAVLFGGNSPEYSVSLQSAYAVLSNLDQERYHVLPLGITRQGRWFLYGGSYDQIAADTWAEDASRLTPVVVSPDPAVHGLLALFPHERRTIPLDAALPILHGGNGEDGTVQGLLQLAGIPVAGCGTLASALCMDKDRAHKLAQLAGVDVPRSRVLQAWEDPQLGVDFAQLVGYPLFVKPVNAGSSFGISQIHGEAELRPAIARALEYDTQVILEEAIPGFEVGCAVIGTQDLVVGEIDEIELSQGFFDFTEKYTLKTSAIHVPARVSPDTARRVKETAKVIYRALGCAGFARVDCFLTPQGRIVFNEVNTIPGFTEHSRFPGMMQAAGWTFPEILNAILGQVVAP